VLLNKEAVRTVFHLHLDNAHNWYRALVLKVYGVLNNRGESTRQLRKYEYINRPSISTESNNSCTRLAGILHQLFQKCQLCHIV